MHQYGEKNLGEFCKEAFQDRCYSIGFGTHTGTVEAASFWGGEVEIRSITPSHPDCIESLFHTCHSPSFILPLREKMIHKLFLEQKLERAIGVIYDPYNERSSHYFDARLSEQFDEYIWFDRTSAITPLQGEVNRGPPQTYPFGE